MIQQERKLAEVFQDVNGHLEIAEIIRTFSTNKEDIRDVALEGIDISKVRNVIDLGCGFGFFTDGLCYKIEHDLNVSGIDRFAGYSENFLNICERCGFRGNFYNTGIKALQQFTPNSIDLVLCSYSLYFFPEVLRKLIKLLNNSATCVFITHSASNLHEITSIVLNIIQKKEYKQIEKLPHEELMENFTDENGYLKLVKFFNKVEKRDFLNDLVFSSKSSDKFLKYFHYKKSFFIPEFLKNDLGLFHKIEEELLNRINSKEGFRITKNDTIYICSDPKKVE